MHHWHLARNKHIQTVTVRELNEKLPAFKKRGVQVSDLLGNECRSNGWVNKWEGCYSLGCGNRSHLPPMHQESSHHPKSRLGCHLACLVKTNFVCVIFCEITINNSFLSC